MELKSLFAVISSDYDFVLFYMYYQCEYEPERTLDRDPYPDHPESHDLVMVSLKVSTVVCHKALLKGVVGDTLKRQRKETNYRHNLQ